MTTTAGRRAPGAGHGASIRPATPDDHPAIVELAGRALGWRTGEPHGELFRWKHVDNVFGRSAMWVAAQDDRLVAFRAMMRWRFVRDGLAVDAVRAVDTATDPDHQGQGLFTRLTMHAVDELRDEGAAFVFNTPNGNSRPGYLTMGWQVVGRVPVGVRVRSPVALGRLARARVPAGKWSLETDADEPASAVLSDDEGLASLLRTLPNRRGLATERSIEFLRWRYGSGPVHYRAARRGGGIEQGVAFYRLRSRGAAIEATVADVLVPGGDERAARRLIDRIVRASGADYAIHAQRPLLDGAHVRLAGQGPILTWRALVDASEPPLDDWRLAMGDIELF